MSLLSSFNVQIGEMYGCFESEMDQYSPTSTKLRGRRREKARECRLLHGGMKQPAAVGRNRWMSDLAAAIDGAQQVAWQLGTAPGASAEARELYARLEAARLELEALRSVTAELRQDIERSLVDGHAWFAGSMGPPD